jgi:hypothetical protein
MGVFATPGCGRDSADPSPFIIAGACGMGWPGIQCPARWMVLHWLKHTQEMVTTAMCEEYQSRLARRHCRSDISNETFLRILQLQNYSWFERRPQFLYQQNNIPIPRSILFVCTPIHYFTDTLSDVGRYTPRYHSVGEKSIPKSQPNYPSVRRHETGRVLTCYHAPKTAGIFKWFKCDGLSYTTSIAEDRDSCID